MSAVTQLLTPLSFLRIRHPLKRQFDVVIPAVLAAIGTGMFWVLPTEIKIFGDQGLLSAITGLIQILTGFYIASLAAVATFQHPTLDSPIAGSPAMLRERIKGVVKDVSLSRRRFLSLLFGYLAFMGLVLYFVGALANLLADNVKLFLPDTAHAWAKWGFVLIYQLAVANLLVTTLLGLHYMADRIHR